jgi:hypothetical protein
VSSKEALLHSVLTSFFALPSEAMPELPITAPPLQVTLDAVRAGLARDGATPGLLAALHADAPEDVRAELSEILEEMYSMISRLWPVLAVLERCGNDIPAIQEFYFGGQRRGHHSLCSLCATPFGGRTAQGLRRPRAQRPGGGGGADLASWHLTGSP